MKIDFFDVNQGGTLKIIFATFALVLSFSTSQAATDMVKAYKRTNGQVRKYCNSSFKSKKMEKDCYSWWEKHVKKECSSKPYNKCFFDEKKMTYKEFGAKKWVKIKDLIDKNFK